MVHALKERSIDMRNGFGRGRTAMLVFEWVAIEKLKFSDTLKNRTIRGLSRDISHRP